MKRACVLILIFCAILFSGCIENFQQTATTTTVETTTIITTTETTTTPETTTTTTIEKNLHVHFIDVGEGDAILIEKEGRYMLIDCGNDYRKIYYYLFKKNISELDNLIVTNLRDEHVGACDTVLENFKVGRIFNNGQTYYSDAYKRYFAKAQNISHEILSREKILWFNDVSLEVLWPPVRNPSGNMAKNSIVMRLTYGKVKFMLMSDCNSDCENQLYGDLSAQILKVGYEGDKTATSQSFLNKVKPDVAILSTGENIYGHPSYKALQVLDGIELHRTDLEGNLVIETDGEKFGFQ